MANLQPIDTHEEIGTLTREYDVPTKQAEGIVRSIMRGQRFSTENLATKADLANLERELKEKMATKEDLANLEEKMATKESQTNLEARMATKEDLAEVKTEVVEIRTKLNMLLWLMPVGLALMTIVIKYL